MKKGNIKYLIYHTVSEDAEVEPRTVATLALAARRFNGSATSHLPKETGVVNSRH
jgi:hypothetical protein